MNFTLSTDLTLAYKCWYVVFSLSLLFARNSLKFIFKNEGFDESQTCIPETNNALYVNKNKFKKILVLVAFLIMKEL